MLGWKLFARALSLLADNVGPALRVSAVPYAILAAVAYGAAAALPELAAPVPVDAVDPTDPEAAAAAIPPGRILLGTVLLFVNLLLGSWVSVGWHRYVLTGDAPSGWVPPFDARTVIAYVGLSIGLVVVLILIVAAITTMVSVAILPLFGPGAYAFVVAVGVICGAVLFFRLSPVLPARAVGVSMGFGEAMRTTKGHSTTAVVLAIVSAAFLLLLQVPPFLDGMGGTAVDPGAVETTPTAPAGGPIGFTYQIVAQWIALMIGAGVLTAFYGHLVEGRPVD